MSYCVNCGVELDGSLKQCPLCNTPVINLSELEKETPPSPFPSQKGQVETVRSKDLAVFFSIVLSSTGVTCALLNLLVFSGSLWSLPIIGICAIIWVFIIPFIIYTKLPVYISVFLDGTITGLYLYLITYMTSSNRWFFGIGIPLVIMLTVIAEVIVFLCRRFPVSFLGAALYFVIATAAICIGTESILDLYFHEAISLFWSAIVLTVCIITTIALITLLSRKRLRNAVRRRLHF